MKKIIFFITILIVLLGSTARAASQSDFDKKWIYEPLTDETTTLAPDPVEPATITTSTLAALAVIPDNFYKGKITKIVSEGTKNDGQNYIEQYQNLEATLLEGPYKGDIVKINNSDVDGVGNFQKAKVGDLIIVGETVNVPGQPYYLADQYRIGALWLMGLFFLALIIFFGRWKGLGSLAGLCFSILILAKFIVPQLAAGHDPLVITLIGSFFIIVISLYIAHGFSKRTSLSVASSLITLVLAVGLAMAFVSMGRLFGFGSEEAFFLQLGSLGKLNFQGLLLSGIIIGVLGVLDDITTAQSATIEEIHKANPSLAFKELYHRGLSVGHEHIASLVNTLALAYAGVSLPLFLLFTQNQQQPWWTIINSEMIADELVRTIVGSSALILAVPISTYLAARYFGRRLK